MKWSDGEPFTADDFMFWFEDIYLNKDLVTTPWRWGFMQINAKPVAMEKVGRQYTVVWGVSPDPYSLVAEGASLRGGGQIGHHARYGSGRRWAASHRSTTSSSTTRNTRPRTSWDKKLAKDAGVDNWVTYFLKKRTRRSRNVGSTGPDALEDDEPRSRRLTWTLERNPYSGLSSTPRGNQLPYIDKCVMTLAKTWKSST